MRIRFNQIKRHIARLGKCALFINTARCLILIKVITKNGQDTIKQALQGSTNEARQERT